MSWRLEAEQGGPGCVLYGRGENKEGSALHRHLAVVNSQWLQSCLELCTV